MPVKPVPQARRELQALSRGAQQDLGRAQGAGREHHLARGERPHLADAVLGAEPVVDGPAAARAGLEPAHLDLGEDPRPLGLGIGQVVHRQRVLGADVAPGHAVVAVDAGLLVHAHVVRPLVAEVHRDVDRAVLVVGERRGALAEDLRLGERRPVRVRVGPQHVLGALVPAPELARAGELAVDRGPAGVVEELRVGADGDVGVDQRRAAQAVALEHVDVLAQVVVEEAERVALAAQVLGEPRAGVRELAGEPLPAALEQADVLPRLGEAGGGDGAAVAGADDGDRHLLAELAGDVREGLVHGASSRSGR